MSAAPKGCAQFTCCAIEQDLSEEERRVLKCQFDDEEVPATVVDGTVRCRPPTPLPPADPERAGLRMRVVGGHGKVLHERAMTPDDLDAGAGTGDAAAEPQDGTGEPGAAAAGRRPSLRQRLAKSALLPFAIISSSYLLFMVSK